MARSSGDCIICGQRIHVDLCKGVEETARLVSTAEAVFLALHDRDPHFGHLPQIVRV